MSKMTRAEFLGLGSLLATAAIGCNRLPEAEVQVASSPFAAEPDLVVVNGRVYPSDGAQPRVEAFAVKNGRFIAVGRWAEQHGYGTVRVRSKVARIQL